MAELHFAVVSDVICPWCYLGERRLERALEQLDLAGGAAFTWLPFELNPDMPPEGMERDAYRAAKFGAQKSDELDRHMTDLGAREGVAFAFDRQRRTPNTRRAHMLIAGAGQAGTGGEMAEALFRAYFEEGRDVGSTEVLLDAARQAGFEDAAAALEDEALREQVVDLERQAARIGVTGVPFFIVNQTYAVSGAQPTENWIEAIGDIREREAARAGGAAP
jgi:predicted DsbA family dithiol-disulfide isomerase